MLSEKGVRKHFLIDPVSSILPESSRQEKLSSSTDREPLSCWRALGDVGVNGRCDFYGFSFRFQEPPPGSGSN